MRLTAALVCALLLESTAVQAQVPGMPARDVAAQKTGTSQLSGRVLDAVTNKPLRRATVRATTPELREGRSATTDADGRWTLRSLPAGKYTINVTKGGYVTLNYGQRRPFEGGQQVDLAAGQAIDKLEMSLPRGGVITGRIVDEFGEPFAGIRVIPMRQRFFNGQRRLVAIGTGDVTDDIGQYRLHGLTPGEYYVSATNSVIMLDVSEDKMGYAPTYYPGSTLLSDAQRVPVTIGQETANVNFDLPLTRVATVSGTATDSQGKPLANSVIMMTSPMLYAGVPTISPALVRPDGTFTISNVTPGDYRLETLSATDLQEFAANRGQVSPAEAASLPVTVTGEDLTGLTLVSAPTGAAGGRVVFEGESQPKVPAGSVTIIAMTPLQTSILPGRLATVREDWTFELKGLTERRIIRANPPSGWFLKSVMANGTDITDSGVEIKPGEALAGIEVLLTRRAASLSGTATADAKPSKDFVVVAFVADRARWGALTRYVRTARPDQSGRFEIKGLPAETYLVVALEYLEPGEEADPEVLERLRPLATEVMVAEGEAKVVSLKVR